MIEDYSPNVGNLASEYDRMPKRVKVWRCKECGYIEKIK